MKDMEFCVPSDRLQDAVAAFTAREDFCSPFRPLYSPTGHHLQDYPRFKVKNVNQFIFLVPDTHYGLEPLDPEKFVPDPSTDLGPIRVLYLACYIEGLLHLRSQPRCQYFNETELGVNLEYLIDGMDIDEEWSDHNLGPTGGLSIRRLVTREGKRLRVGTTWKEGGGGLGGERVEPGARQRQARRAICLIMTWFNSTTCRMSAQQDSLSATR